MTFDNQSLIVARGFVLACGRRGAFRIRCYYDDRPYLEVRDTTFDAAGKVGLWTKADAQT